MKYKFQDLASTFKKRYAKSITAKHGASYSKKVAHLFKHQVCNRCNLMKTDIRKNK